MSDESASAGPHELPEGGAVAPPEEVKRWGVVERVTGMFTKPTATFQAMKSHPTWLVAFLISLLFTAATSFVYSARVPYPVRREADFEKFMKITGKMGASPEDQQKAREEYDQQTRQGETLFQKLAEPFSVTLSLFLLIVVGAGLYQVGAILLGNRLTFKRALAVRAYAELPPMIILSLFLIIQMYLKSPEEIVGYKGMLLINLGALVKNKEAYIVLGTIANSLDLFQFWSLALAIIGLTVMLDKMKRGAAIGIVGAVWLLGLLMKIAVNSLAGIMGM